MILDSNEIRSHFPSLRSGAIYFDNPGGTQVTQEVIDAITHYYKTSNANTHGVYETSRRTGDVVDNARQAMADFLNARSPKEIVFGQNMTSLTFALSRSIGKTIKPGDEIIVTYLDHDANITPWFFLKEQGATVKLVKIKPADCTLDLADFEEKLSEKTKLVAVGHASNAVGSINDVKKITKLAHAKGAMVFVDSVHYAPHGPIDVQDIDCDFLACSAYKFYGPHIGALYGKLKHLEHLEPYKVRPAENTPPDRFETGTQNFEALSGVRADIDFLASVGDKYGGDFSDTYSYLDGRRLILKAAMSTIQIYERNLFTQLIGGLENIGGIRIFGITDREYFAKRAPTIAFTIDGYNPKEIAEYLAGKNIYVWHGNYYALALMEYLGLEEKGGAVRIGIGVYNTREEIEQFIETMKRI
ncbi:MAG: cysteine desulfurase-like protein [Proteobacteria bacterium]|nr:cysteine desulfurase-like protein [Pseudomonadota bacterium]